jgi:sugar (pentulose or hexulose) kinase
MTGPYLVGIDCGTQSAKVVVYDASGRVAASGQQPLRPMSRPEHGVAIHPDDDLWDAIATASRAALAEFKGDPNEIVAVGLCPIRCCKAFLASDGSLVEPVISWMDDRAYQPYLPTDPTTRYATTTTGYLAHRLTDEFKDTAANNIALQWPIDTDTWQWSDDPEVYEQFGVPREMLFDLQMPGDVIGPLTAEASAATGLPVGVAVVATANDKAVEMLGSGSLDNTTALVSLGTYIAAMVHGDENHSTPTNFWTNFASIPHRYLYESNGVRRGMWTLTWFLDLLGPEFAERVESLGTSREAFIECEAIEVPAGCDGLMTVLDWLATTDKPFRKGMMLGFDARHSRGHVYRSILEAIALTMKHHVDAMCAELEITLDEIVVSGGGSTSPLFMQIFADVFAVPASRNVAGSGAAVGGGGASLGAAMCAAAASGVHPDIATAAEQMAHERETFTPDDANRAIYARIADTVYHDIRNHTDALFERAYPIFHSTQTLEASSGA